MATELPQDVLVTCSGCGTVEHGQEAALRHLDSCGDVPVQAWVERLLIAATAVGWLTFLSGLVAIGGWAW